MNTNNALMQRRHNAVPRGVGQIHPIFAGAGGKIVGSGMSKAVSISISRAALPS
ncbi:4-aminobutyrate aminotransferase [Salmonella enterica subsp. enterica]|nr:4-aminobutyrate aminotransferase [Salmonella enterica subsp. enterica]